LIRGVRKTRAVLVECIEMAMNKRTAAHIANEIAMTRQQIKQADAQIEELQAQREAHVLTVEALEAILARESSQTDLLSVANIQVPPSKEQVMESPALGLRDGIRTVLREANCGMRGRDVTAALAAKGIHITGKVDPASRVAGELYRLKQSGQVRRRAGKYYAIESAGGEA
jgi:hypothetical protein